MKKWLVITFLSVCIFTIAKPLPIVHPYHVGSVEVNYNMNTQTYQITAKFFLDDLENAINKDLTESLSFGKTEEQTKINKVLENYTLQHLVLKSEKEKIVLNFLGFEEKSESVYLYLESKVVPKPKELTIGVNMLYNLFEDQLNIVHLRMDGERISHRLDYPEIYFTKEF